MPYKDPERKREHSRLWQQAHRRTLRLPRVALRQPGMDEWNEAECVVCGAAMPVSPTTGWIVAHYPEDSDHAYSTTPGYFCRGSNRYAQDEG